MDAFTTLLIGHLIADFPLQIGPILAAKKRGGLGVAPHVAIHLMVMILLIGDPPRHWPLFAFVAISHYLIDVTKLAVDDGTSGWAFLLDQLAHVAILWVAPQVTKIVPTPVSVPAQPLVLVLTISSAAFMYLFIIHCQEKRLPLPRFAQAHALYFSKGAGWLAVAALFAVGGA